MIKKKYSNVKIHDFLNILKMHHILILIYNIYIDFYQKKIKWGYFLTTPKTYHESFCINKFKKEFFIIVKIY